MKLSFHRKNIILERLEKAVRLFPLSAVAVGIHAIILLFFVFNSHSRSAWLFDEFVVLRMFFSLPLIFASEVIISKLKKQSFKYLVYAADILLIGLFTFWIQSYDRPPYAFIQTQVIIALTWFALLVAPALMDWKEDISKVRKYVSRTLINLIFAGISVGVSALAALFLMQVSKSLFNLSGEWLELLQFPFAFLIGSALFLGLSAESKDLYEIASLYQKIVNIVLKYILLPFYLVYSAILYLSLLVNFLQFRWPDYQVSWTILGNLVFGLLLFLFWDHENGKKIESFIKRFFAISSLPLIVVYSVGVITRVANYGWTINRYLAVIMAIYFTFLCVYILLTKRQIALVFTLIPMTMALLSFFGPWSSINLSADSQMEVINRYYDQICNSGTVESIQALDSYNYLEQIFGEESQNLITLPVCQNE